MRCAGAGGSVSNAVDIFNQCPVGCFFSNSICTPCAAGSYNGLSGQSSCIPCPPGTSNPLVAGTSIAACTPCLPPSYSASGQSFCSDCPPGYYCPNSALSPDPSSASVFHTIHMRPPSITFAAPRPRPYALSLMLFMVALTTPPTPTQCAPVTIASHARVAASGALRSVPANSVTLRQGGDYQVRHRSRHVHLRAQCWSNAVSAAISCK
jgi:hypothetical protein